MQIRAWQEFYPTHTTGESRLNLIFGSQFKSMVNSEIWIFRLWFSINVGNFIQISTIIQRWGYP